MDCHLSTSRAHIDLQEPAYTEIPSRKFPLHSRPAQKVLAQASIAHQSLPPTWITSSKEHIDLQEHAHTKPAQKVFAQASIVHLSLPHHAAFLNQLGDDTALPDALRTHTHVAGLGFDTITFLGNSLIQMYGACDSLHYAEISFQRLPFPDPCSFSLMMKVYCQHGCLNNARTLFECIPDPNLYSWHVLINGLCQHGCMDIACEAFAAMPHRNHISWNTIISAFTKNGCEGKAIEYFYQMQVEGFEPDRVAFISALDACASLASIAQGQKIYAYVVGRGFEQDVVIGTAALNMYGKCGCLHDAVIVFNRLHCLDIVSFTAMINAFTQMGHFMEALDLLKEMRLNNFEPDLVTFVCAIDACHKIDEGKAVQAETVLNGCELDVTVGTSLINMFGRCREPCDATVVFNRLPTRNIVTWNSMLAVYKYNAYTKEALEMFNRMQPEGIRPDKVTIVSALQACISHESLQDGRNVHAISVEYGHEDNVEVGTALMDMYGKGGSLNDAKCILNRMHRRDAITWSVFIAVLARNGFTKEALDVFDMMQSEGIIPDKVTFLNVLNACSHAGQVASGKEYYDSMSKDHGLAHSFKHLLCMVDLLSRAGYLQEAEDLISSSSFRGSPNAWAGLLSACKLHGDVERAVRVAKLCAELGWKGAGHYVAMLNLYATAGESEERRGMPQYEQQKTL